MARSIGDHHAATIGVIPDPEITEYDFVKEDVALIIASDGVWELLSSQTVVDIVANIKTNDPNEICEVIVDQASNTCRCIPPLPPSGPHNGPRAKWRRPCSSPLRLHSRHSYHGCCAGVLYVEG
jgi:hypothetical protein